ncbi:MAG: GTPase [Nitrospirae bacterium]|nr:GTPase [Nitrospirota bacterium]
MKDPIKLVIMGAAGRDFHNFNVVFRDDPRYRVVAFTAAQIPNIEGRRYPPGLAGALYPEGIPIYPEEELPSLIETHRIDQVAFAYSDVSHEEVMHKASRVIAYGADFRLLGARATMLVSSKPVVSICAVRTGCGKSPVARKVAAILKRAGLRIVVVRHPMPYGDLAKQVLQRFASLEDLRRADCTIEEMEEYEPHIVNGDVVYAGIDYEQILRQAEGEADVLLWDGGNNDLPFYVPDLELVLVDPHRAGHERTYFPGEANLLRADVIILTKLDSADPAQVEAVRRNIRSCNPQAVVIDSRMPLTLDKPELLADKRVLVVEDGPTLTHGGMGFGAGVLAARQFHAGSLVDPRPYAVGSLQNIFSAYPQIGPLLPAMGYGPTQIRELEDTIRNVTCDVVLIATPIDLRRVITIRQPTCRVTYEFEEIGRPTLQEVLSDIVDKAKHHA